MVCVIFAVAPAGGRSLADKFCENDCSDLLGFGQGGMLRSEDTPTSNALFALPSGILGVSSRAKQL